MFHSRGKERSSPAFVVVLSNCRSSPWRCMPTVTCPIPAHESIQVRRTWRVRSYEGKGSVENPRAARRSWPRGSSTAYWITWSARWSSVCGIVRPSALAVLRLITNSQFVGCSTGRSAGLAPFKILSTKVAVLRNRSEKSAE
jgi:hypothetical protein